MPNQNSATIIETIQKIVDEVITARNNLITAHHVIAGSSSAQRLSAKLTIKNNLPCAYIDPNHPLALACATAVKEVTGIDPPIQGCGPANEGYMLIGQNIPTICGFGVEGGNPHSSDEWIRVDSILETVEIYSKVVVHQLKQHKQI